MFLSREPSNRVRLFVLHQQRNSRLETKCGGTPALFPRSGTVCADTVTTLLNVSNVSLLRQGCLCAALVTQETESCQLARAQIWTHRWPTNQDMTVHGGWIITVLIVGSAAVLQVNQAAGVIGASWGLCACLCVFTLLMCV